MEIKEHPIIFSAEMVRAILEGRKTQTRRIVKNLINTSQKYRINGFTGFKPHPLMVNQKGCWLYPHEWSPYGQPGDRLWVREAFQSYVIADRKTYYHYKPTRLSSSGILYKADNPVPIGVWIPSIYMPRWASRITLEIINIRVERVQEITEEDANAEGLLLEQGWYRNFCLRLKRFHRHYWENVIGGDGQLVKFYGEFLATKFAKTSFATLWDSINAKRYEWNTNPWVWVIEFRRIDVN